MKVPLRGEIWQSEDELLHIVGVHSNIVNFVYKSYGRFYADNMSVSSFVRLYRFVAIAKVDVWQLFER